MPDHIKPLVKVRAQMVKVRRGLVEALSEPGAQSNDRTKFIAAQNIIDLIDRAIVDEEKIAAEAPRASLKHKGQGYAEPNG